MNQNGDLTLGKNPTLDEFHQYVQKMEKIRGFSEQTVLEKCLL